MLMVAKSIAQFLTDTTSFDLGASIVARKPNEVQRADATLDWSSAVAEANAMADLNTTVAFATNVGDSPCFVGVVWSTSRMVGAVRYYWPAGFTAPTVKLQTLDGSTWSDIPTGGNFALTAGWNTLLLEVSQYALGVRVVYVSGGAEVRLRCAELEVYEDLRVEPRPADWAEGGVHVVHPDLDLSPLQTSLVTVGVLPADREDGDVGGGTKLEHDSYVVGIHCPDEHTLEAHRAWAESVLDLAQAPDRAGTLRPGIPLRASNLEMRNVTGGSWWTSQQGGWFTSPAPAVRVDGVTTAPATIDYGRGRVQLPGVASTSDVRADFTCGVWEFDVSSAMRSELDAPSAILHRHNVYFVLDAVGHFRDIQNALV